MTSRFPSVHWLLSPQRLLELAAAIVTLAGQAIGSTTLPGALCYALATTLWIWLTVVCRLWGLLPLNIASVIITGWTLWSLTIG